MAYEFIRFSEDATLVDGVWTGTFTDADSTKVSQKETAQGNTKNLILYSEFGLWNSDVNVPVGWSQNGNPLTFLRQYDNNNVAWVRFSGIGGNNSTGFRLATTCTVEDGPLYLIPNTYNQTYNISVRYKGNGRPMIVVHYWKWQRGSTIISWLDTFAEYIYGGTGSDDSVEHTLTGSFTSRDSEATHFDIQLVHEYGQGDVNTEYEFAFAEPKVEIGSAPTAYLPSPKEDLLGTTQGLWKGVLHWSNPYASSDFSLYEWSKVRDAEPRMGTWGEGNCTHIVRTDLPEEDKYFYCGAYGEPYYDIVYYKETDVYWMCMKTYRRDLKINVVEDGATVEKPITPADENLWTMYWERASQFNFLMAKTLYAIDAFIERLVVNKLSTQTTDGSAKIDIQNGMIVVSSLVEGNNTSIRFGVDGEGNAIQQYYDGDTLLYDLGPNGINDNIEVVENSHTPYTYISVGSSIDNISPIILNTTGQPRTTYYKFNEGYRRTNNVITYNVGDNGDKSRPSQYDGNTYTGRDPYAPTSTAVLISNGRYRNTHDNDSEYFMVPTTSGTEVYFCQMFRYYGGKLVQTVDYYFTKSGNYGYRCDRSGNPIT